MITYNPRDWFRLIFHFHRSDTFRILLPTMILLGTCTAALVYLELHHHLIEKSSTVFHQIFGFALSMLLVFRINTAYERWWEGRKLWGALINNSRSVAAKWCAYLKNDQEDLRYLLHLLSSFPEELKEFLRQTPERREKPVTKETRHELWTEAAHPPYFIYTLMVDRLEHLRCKGSITGEQLLALNAEVFSLIDITGACERIKNSPIPFSYSIFLKKILFVYVITMPIPFSIEFGYWSVLAVMVIFYVFASLELISEEVEDPFGEDSNDLPLDDLTKRIQVDIASLYSTDSYP